MNISSEAQITLYSELTSVRRITCIIYACSVLKILFSARDNNIFHREVEGTGKTKCVL